MANQNLSQAIPFLAEFIKLSDYMKIHATNMIRQINSDELDPDEKVLCLDALADMLDTKKNENIAKVIQEADKIVSTWPKWKQNILKQSGRPTVSTTRKPIANDDVY
jgi:hypothetical protein